MGERDKEMLKAIELALAGKWEAAHELVQQYEGDPTAAWIHAVLHKQEGDLGNSGYWYRRAGKQGPGGEEPKVELEAIREEINARG